MKEEVPKPTVKDFHAWVFGPRFDGVDLGAAKFGRSDGLSPDDTVSAEGYFAGWTHAMGKFVHIGYRDGDGPLFQVRPGQSVEGFKKVFELVEEPHEQGSGN